MRATYKVPGGKLVGVDVDLSPDGKPLSCRIDGDFFIDTPSDSSSQALLDDLAAALVRGESLSDARARHPEVRLVGADEDAIAIAFDRALGVSQRHGSSPTSAEYESRSAAGAGRRVGDGIRGGVWRQERAAALRVRVVRDRPRPPREQMNTDEDWARMTAGGVMTPTLRFWEWSAPAVVVGRYQSIDAEVNVEEAEREGFTVVRRCTGGGAMFIEPGNTITYSLIAPLDFVAGMSVEDSYRLCDQWLIDALKALGIEAFFSGVNDISSPQGKIGGAAQRRFPARDGGPGAVLHHVTLAYDIDARAMARILTPSAEKLADKAVRSAAKRVDPMRSQTGMSRDEVIRHLVRSASSFFQAVQ